MTIPSLYALTDASAVETQLEQVRQFVDAGVRIIQIRDKQASGRQLYETVVAALELTRPQGVLLIVNDRVDVALAARADGVHVGQDDLDVSSVRRILGASVIVGVSTHTVEQAGEAARDAVDYVAFGPVFPTSTKADLDPVVGLEGLATVRSVVRQPLVAIGGITLERAPSVFSAGADSIAVVSDLRAGPSVDERVRAYARVLPSRS